MSLNSLESEGLRPLHFLPGAHLAPSALARPDHWMLSASWPWCQEGTAARILFLEEQLPSLKTCSEEVWGYRDSLRQTAPGALENSKERVLFYRQEEDLLDGVS